MQVTINIPDNLPQTAIQQQVHEIEEKRRRQAKQVTLSDTQYPIGLTKNNFQIPPIFLEPLP